MPPERLRQHQGGLEGAVTRGGVPSGLGADQRSTVPMQATGDGKGLVSEPDLLAVLRSIDLSLRRLVVAASVSQTPNLDLANMVPEWDVPTVAVGKNEAGKPLTAAAASVGLTPDGEQLGAARVEATGVEEWLRLVHLELKRIRKGIELSQTPNLNLEGLVPE